jgi:cystathionine beta-lyase/cystathionine gamma-synthase
MKPDTDIQHPPLIDLPADNRPLVQPVYQNVKFEFDTIEEAARFMRGERGGFYYSRLSNPTTRQLELALAKLQGRDDALSCGSGVAAVATTLAALVSASDHVLMFAETYNPTRQIVRRLLARYGVRHTMLSIDDLAGIERVLAATPTRLVVFESPTNPVVKIADIERICSLARAHGALTVLDNTFAGFHQHGQYDVDYFVHSLTKFASGTGDVMGGIVIGSAERIRSIRSDWGLFGASLDPHAAFLLMRGLKSYFVRYRAQCANALAVAQWLAARPEIGRVRYPGLGDDRHAALARRQMSDFGVVVTCDLQAGAEAGRRFAEGLKLFAVAASLGSTADATERRDRRAARLDRHSSRQRATVRRARGARRSARRSRSGTRRGALARHRVRRDQLLATRTRCVL